jgi:nicotinate-nucleotide pyrophosphorylase (carboxylating)
VSDWLNETVKHALGEDLGTGDLTSEATIPVGLPALARITQKQPGVVAGLEVAALTFKTVEEACVVSPLVEEGVWRTGGPVMEIRGTARALLAGERTALNFLQRLSGVATLTAQCVRAVAGTGVTILDTRKTTPGLRALEKAAVVAGGGQNHRTGLYDAILIKENHAAIAGGVGEAVRRALAQSPGVMVEVECETIAQVDQALEAGAPRILLDNMTPAELSFAVAHVAGRAELEASGGFKLDSLREVAETGVNFISIGALTHSAPALDLSLLLEPTG